MPVVQKSAEHGAGLPPVVRRIQYAGIASEDLDAFFVTSRILRNELFRDQCGNILDRFLQALLATVESYWRVEPMYQEISDPTAKLLHVVAQKKATVKRAPLALA